MSEQSFDELLKPTKSGGVDVETQPIDTVEKDAASELPLLPPRPAKKKGKKAAVTVSEPVAVETDLEEDAQETAEVVEDADAPDVSDPDYALYYYKGEPRNWAAASLWFAFAYTVLAWPLTWVASYINVLLENLKLGFLELLPVFAYAATVPLAVISALVAAVSFILNPRRGQKVYPAIIALLLAAGTAVGVFFVFLYQ